MIATLLTNAALLLAVMMALWLVAVRIRDVSFIDSVWALGMVMLTIVTYATQAEPGVHDIVIAALVTMWGLRLGLHLLGRWWRTGVDPRYARIIGSAVEKNGWSFATAALLLVFLTQAPLLYLVCLPAQVGLLSPAPPALGIIGMIGTALAIIGIAFETIGDYQLERFRADPANHGKVLCTGLWRYTRHPNYFGDACTWWGIWLVSSETAYGLWTLPAPLFLTWTLMRWSGAPLLERGLKKRRPDYEAYIARTSSFVPWPPRS